MRIHRNLGEVLSKVSPKTLFEVARLVRDTKDPVRQLQVFLGFKELKEGQAVELRSGYQIPISSIHDFQQIYWDCWVRKSYSVKPTDKIIFDIGANIGCFALYALVKSPQSRVYAFRTLKRQFQTVESPR